MVGDDTPAATAAMVRRVHCPHHLPARPALALHMQHHVSGLTAAGQVMGGEGLVMWEGGITNVQVLLQSNRLVQTDKWQSRSV